MTVPSRDDSAAPTLILASASPRRAQLLREAGYEFDIVEPDIDEDALLEAGYAPAELAEKLALLKARAGRNLVADAGNTVVLGGDTVVALENRVFGKPQDEDDARRILLELAGRAQQVITGVTLISGDRTIERTAHAVTTVWMRKVSKRELEAYIAGGEWRGKAGAYGIQDPGMSDSTGMFDSDGAGFVTRIEGSYSNVVGFPIDLVTEMLAEIGITPPADA